MEFKHISVMLDECIEGLNIKEDGIYVDCTLGGAGHSLEILKKLSPKGKLIGIDQDLDALNEAKNKLKDYNNVIFVHDNFYNLREILGSIDIPKVDGILMDLGVSSYQLDEGARGFSYMKDAPLDMRMNREQAFSAYNVVNEYSEDELFSILKEFGEEKFSRSIARKILARRVKKPIETTLELVEIIDSSIPGKFKREGGHPAKRTFQAIRIEVNKELHILNKAVEDGVEALNSRGRLAIITFHSLEDRIIKSKFRDLNNPCTCPKSLPVCLCGKKPAINLVNRKPIEASADELEINSRSRSAKLRICEKN